MKFLCLCSAICLSLTNVMADNVVEAVGGLNVSNLSANGITGNSKVGFHVGIKDYVYFSGDDGCFVSAGALVSTKGYKYGEGDKVTLGYLEVPVHFGFHYEINRDISVLGSVGPYLSLGLFGNEKYTEFDFYYGGGDEVKQSSFGDGGEYKRFDMGLGFGASLLLKNKFSVGVGYELGLANICKSNEDEFDDDWGFLDDVIKWRNRNFQVTLGYRF